MATLGERVSPRSPPKVATPAQAMHAAFLCDCLEGLVATPKSLPCKWLYDDVGSLLFERITGLPEYYPFRTEEALLRGAAPLIAAELAYGTTLVELGSGASRKTRLLLDAVPAISTYVPIDISFKELTRAAKLIRTDYLGLSVNAIHADFTTPATIDLSDCERPLLLFFPGSTLGNFAPDDAVVLLREWRDAAGSGARLLLGVDLAKDERALVRAYDDSAGVTAAFNLNLLHRMNRELGCGIDVGAFAHRAVWNAAAARIEMHLIARQAQQILLGSETIRLEAGESIHTESSYKLPREGWLSVFAEAGWRVAHAWEHGKPTFLLALLAA